MADLMLSNSTWAVGTTDSASTLVNGVDQKRAEHINGPASAVIALETVLGSASSLKGSHADLATRLAVQLPASGKLIDPGVIWMYGGSTAPAGWLICDGASVSRSTFADLFAAIGTDYGNGTGSGLDFTLPDMRGRMPVGVGTGTGGGATGTTGTKPAGGLTLRSWLRGAWFGSDTHQLSIPEMPAHTHNYNVRAGVGIFTGPGAQGWDAVNTNGGTTTSAGSTQPHNNVPAAMCVNFIIKT